MLVNIIEEWLRENGYQYNSNRSNFISIFGKTDNKCQEICTIKTGTNTIILVKLMTQTKGVEIDVTSKHFFDELKRIIDIEIRELEHISDNK